MDKKLFRFRFPWRNSPRSTEEPEPRPTPKTQKPAESTTTAVPGDRPPFRPAGRAPVKGSPSQAQVRKKSDPAESHAANESPKTQSPSRLSPSKKSQTTTQQSSPTSSDASSQPQPVQEEAISQPQASRRKIEITFETDSSTEDSILREKFASSDKSDSDTLSDNQKQLSASDTDSKEHKEAEKLVQVAAVEKKINDPGYTEPLQERVTQVHAAATDLANKAKDPLGGAVPEDQRHEKQEKVTAGPHAAEKDTGNQAKDPLGVSIQEDQQHEKQDNKVTEVNDAAADSGNHIKDPLGVALQADKQHKKEEKVTELQAEATDSGNHTKDPLGVAPQADQQHEKEEKVTELQAEATDSGNHAKDPLGVALQENQQHKKDEKVIELHAAATDSGNHTKDLPGVALQAYQRQEKKENFDKKETLATTSTDQKPIRTERSSSRVSIQKMVASAGEQAPPSKEIREDVSKFNKLAIKQNMLDKPVGVVTLTGENRGAAMLLSSESGKREEPVHIRRGYNPNSDDTEVTTDGDVSNKEEISEDQMNERDPERSTYINSNVQSINNSIVFDSSVTERDPGVAVYSSNPPASIGSNKESDSLQTHKAQVVQTPADELTHESTVRRRCLRGLFMESSDSEPDNPTKPRRHGCCYICCCYICGKERKETEIGIV